MEKIGEIKKDGSIALGNHKFLVDGKVEVDKLSLNLEKYQKALNAKNFIKNYISKALIDAGILDFDCEWGPGYYFFEGDFFEFHTNEIPDNYKGLHHPCSAKPDGQIYFFNLFDDAETIKEELAQYISQFNTRPHLFNVEKNTNLYDGMLLFITTNPKSLDELEGWEGEVIIQDFQNRATGQVVTIYRNEDGELEFETPETDEDYPCWYELNEFTAIIPERFHQTFADLI